MAMHTVRVRIETEDVVRFKVLLDIFQAIQVNHLDIDEFSIKTYHEE